MLFMIITKIQMKNVVYYDYCYCNYYDYDYYDYYDYYYYDHDYDYYNCYDYYDAHKKRVIIKRKIFMMVTDKNKHMLITCYRSRSRGVYASSIVNEVIRGNFNQHKKHKKNKNLRRRNKQFSSF